jgi:hypothetical protein
LQHCDHCDSRDQHLSVAQGDTKRAKPNQPSIPKVGCQSLPLYPNYGTPPLLKLF